MYTHATHVYTTLTNAYTHIYMLTHTPLDGIVIVLAEIVGGKRLSKRYRTMAFAPSTKTKK